MKPIAIYAISCLTAFFGVVSSAEAQEPKDLKEALVNYTWSWVNGVPEPKDPKLQDKEVRFFENGTARSTSPLDNMWHWKLTDAHSIQLVFEEDGFKRKRGISISFDASFSKLSYNGIRITGARLRPNGQAASPKGPQVPLQSVTTDANQPRIEVIKDQGPNATEWALTPLDESIPADIRQNLTFLREDLLDEAKKNPKAAAAAYTLASDYCDKILNALDQRDLARVNAGYSSAQADANIRVTSQALEARRNYKMSWPQYAREKDQRNEIHRQQSAGADVKREQVKVNWANKAVQMRAYLDDLYTKLRAAMR